MNTSYIKWNKETGFVSEELNQAAQIIWDGGLVAFPTETVYGLGGNGLDPQASQKIYVAKGRPSDNPLILHIAKRKQLEEIVNEIPGTAAMLAEAFWPGPLTMIFRKADCVPYETTGGLDTVAVRMPQHMGALQFLEAADVPVAAPSANTSGRPSPTLAKHVKEDLDGKIDMIIDGGEVGIGFESTIVDVTEEVPVILRPGFITQKMLQEVVGEVQMDPALMQVSAEQKPKAPGMKYRHYAPKAEMTLYQGDTEDVIEHINREIAKYLVDGTYQPEEIGILATIESAGRYPHGQVVVAGSREEDTEGRYLYDALRKFDELQVKRILSETFFDSAKEEAVMNRLKKAAGQNLVQVEPYESCNRVIFVSKDNITLSPMNEWIFKSILMDKNKEVLSRGLVVLFEEPRNMKVTDILINHGIPCEEQVSVAFSPDEVTRDTLIITMNFAEKVKVLEDYGLERNVYTLRELAGEEGDTEPPLGGDEEAYEASYIECKDLLYKIKKKLQWR
ncbi:MAG: L-threonylcarbamoyladenylate synthase [Eubacterium sp.]